jgi:chemotaxis protein CheY-P-specific phosphatase CheC
MNAQAEAISLDVLAESLNLGLGHVVEELASISNSRIELHVPEVNMLPKSEALAFTERMRAAGKAIFVQQQFSGDISGEALLFFSEQESLNLLNGLLGDHEESLVEFAATEEEMLLDLTNIAVSGVIYALSNMLGLHINTELPCCEYGYFEDIRDSADLLSGVDDMILFLTISFTVVSKNSRAQLMFFQPRNTLNRLFDHIQKRMGIIQGG